MTITDTVEKSGLAASTPEDFSELAPSAPDDYIAPFNPFTLENHPEGLPISLSPGDGWLVEMTNIESGGTWTERVVGWVLQSSGTALPLCLQDPNTGDTFFPTMDKTMKCRVYHPDALPPVRRPTLTGAARGHDPDEARPAHLPACRRLRRPRTEDRPARAR